MTFLLIPRCRAVQRRTQLLHLRNNGTPLVALCTSDLELLNDGGMKEQTGYGSAIGFNHKHAAAVVPLDFIDRIIVDKVASTIQNRFVLVDLDASNDMTRMPKDRISTCIDQRTRKRKMFCWRNVPPIWSPMSGYHQNIYVLFCPPHHLKQLFGALLMQLNGNIPDARLFVCGCPCGLVISKGKQPDRFSVHAPYSGCRCLTERGTRTGVVNSRLLQGVHHVKQPLIFKIKHMVIRQRNGVYVRSCKGLHVFCIRAKMKHFGRG